jgi:hypothetical protein
VRTDQHVHAVDLVQPEPVDRPAKLRPANLGRLARAETLRGERNAASIFERQAFGHP